MNKSVTLQTQYTEYNDVGEDLISIYSYNSNQKAWERLIIIEQDKSQNIIKVEINHFSWFKEFFERPLDLIMDIPGEYLQKSDLIYCLAQTLASGSKFWWFPGHAGLFLGTRDANSTINNGYTIIESSPWNVHFSNMDDFKTSNDHLYMGARRYDGIISESDRIKIANYAINKNGYGYSLIGEGNGSILSYTYSCVGLTEASYDDADKSIIPAILEYPFIIPLEQYLRVLPVNEIKVKSNKVIYIPIKGVVWDETRNTYSEDPSKFSATASYPSGAKFDNNAFTWIPDQSNVGKTYKVDFTVTANIGEKNYISKQDLNITVEQGSIPNIAPIASFNIQPKSGNTSTNFSFDASTSSDEQDPLESLQVKWDWTNDGLWDTDFSSIKTATHQYSNAGTYTIKLEVKDTGGLIDTTLRQIEVSFSQDIFNVTNIQPSSSEALVIGHSYPFTVDFSYSVSYGIDNFFMRLYDASGTVILDLTKMSGGTNSGSTTISYPSFTIPNTSSIRLECGINSLIYYNLEFSTTGSAIETGTMVDQDGNQYRTVKIGNQWWMAKNLRVTHYRNGDPITNVTDNTEWSNCSSGAYCYYNNSSDNATIYGCLYNWYAVNDTRKIAPSGWHVPTDAEWKKLEMYLGMSQSDADAENWRGDNVAGKLKETGYSHWASPNTDANNESGFTALPAGVRNPSGEFYWIRLANYLWTSDTPQPWIRGLNYDRPGMARGSVTAEHIVDGYSIRCIKD